MKPPRLRRMVGVLLCAPVAGSAVDRAAADAALRGAVERRAIPGVVALAVDRRGVIYEGAAGLADSDALRPMQADAIFRIASMTKAVTGVALMQLVESGQVSLDEPASKYLPELGRVQKLVDWDPVAQTYRLEPPRTAITIRHLATHTAGFGYGFTSATLRDFKPRDGETLELPPLLFEPGTDWLYGTNIDHLGRLVEKLSGLTLEEYFQQKICRPLGMVDTSYNIPESKRGRLVASHRRGPDGAITQPPQNPPAVVTRFNGGGGLYSTAADYARFLRMLLNGGTLDGVRIVAPATVAEMARNHIGAVGVRALKSALPASSGDFTFVVDGRDKWGVSFQITADAVPGKRAPGSLSWGGIQNTYFWLDPERGVAGVILMQFLPFADPQALELYDAFERAVYSAAR